LGIYVSLIKKKFYIFHKIKFIPINKNMKSIFENYSQSKYLIFKANQSTKIKSFEYAKLDP